MRSACIALLVVALVVGSPMRASARDAGREAALAGASVAANILYTPAKAVLALGGLLAGGITFVATGLNERAAYAIWVPTIGGTYFITPARLDGIKPIHFIGSRYPKTMVCKIAKDEPCEHAKDEPCEHGKHHSGCHECDQ